MGDAHQAMTLAEYWKRFGYSGHLDEIARRSGSENPRADWSAFMMSRDGKPQIRVTRWPTIYRQWLKRKYDAKARQEPPRKKRFKQWYRPG